jgi:hypothetical protein
MAEKHLEFLGQLSGDVEKACNVAHGRAEVSIIHSEDQDEIPMVIQGIIPKFIDIY